MPRETLRNIYTCGAVRQSTRRTGGIISRKGCDEMRSRLIFPLLFCFALALGSCQFRSAPEPESSLPPLSVSGQAAQAPAPGSYYNSQTDVGLVIDSQGAFAMFSGSESLKGTYSLRSDYVVFASGTEETLARLDETGLVFEDMPGVFMPVGVAESFAALGVMLSGDREYTDLGDGRWQVCDYGLGLAFVYPGDMSAPEGLLSDAAVVWDGEKGYALGRNVTESLSGGDPESFLDSYMRVNIPSDFALLHGVSAAWESMELLQENIPGRVASAEGVLVTAAERVYVKVIMYTSTFSDGTVNYICKGFFAPEGDTAAFNALANGVTDMTAVRRK